MTPPLIPDASVVLKWVLPEEGTEAALQLQGSVFVAPDLLMVECANALWSRARRGLTTEAETMEAISTLADAPIYLEPSRDIIGLALKLALQLQHPVYDCLYLALALIRAGTMVTADAKFCGTAKKHPLVRDHIRLLGQ